LLGRSSSDDFPDDLTFGDDLPVRHHARLSRANSTHSEGTGRAPTAADVVASIHGTSPDTQLTARALANMTDAQFEALYNELLHKGDRQKLMDLRGAPRAEPLGGQPCLVTKNPPILSLKMVACYNSQLEQSVDSLG
jgi:hypothetical protein